MLTPIAADAMARRRFTYVADPFGRDTWRSHADTVLAGSPWEGDCDDLASTVLDLLGREGFPLDQRFRLLVSTTSGRVIDHMVAAGVQGGKILILGDTFGPAYDISRMTHRGILFQRMSEAREGIWREGVPTA